MPIYDYQCKKCNKRFTVTMRMLGRNRPLCPKCGSRLLTRVYEPFIAITKKKS